MKTNFRRDSEHNSRLERIQRGFLWFGAGLVVLVLAFFAGRLMLTASAHMLSWGRVIPPFSYISGWFADKGALIEENRSLRDRLVFLEDQVRIGRVYRAQNLELKSFLGRTSSSTSFLLANVLAHPGLSPYDTLVVDLGSKDGIEIGDVAYAAPHSALGTVLSTREDSSVVVLYSAPNRETPVYLGDDELPATLIGRGGGNFQVVLPKDTQLIKGDLALLAGESSRAIAVIADSEAGPDTSSRTFYLSFPVNIFTLPRIFFEAHSS